jgi:short-subunit dehydrogenase
MPNERPGRGQTAAFVLSFSEALWEEARGTGLKVSCLCPGPTKSGFRDRAGTGKNSRAPAGGSWRVGADPPAM